MRMGRPGRLLCLGKILHTAAEGGVGFEELHCVSQTLKMRWFSRILVDDQAIWVHLARASIARGLDFGFRCRSRWLWSAEEAIILDENLHIVGSPHLGEILCGFNRARTSLCFTNVGTVLPSHLTMEQLLLLFQCKEALSPEQEGSVLGILKHHGVLELSHLRDGIGGWRTINSFRVSTRVTRQGDDPGLVWLISNTSCLVAPGVGLRLQDSNGLSWKVGKKSVRSWTFPNKVWWDILSSPRSNFDKLNS